MKATPRKLAYANFDKEAPARSLARGFSDRFSLKSFGTSDTHRQTHFASKSQRTPSKNKELTHLKRSKRVEDQSITKEKARRERSKSRRKRSRHQEKRSDSEHEEGSKDAYEDLNSTYRRPKPTPFTQLITSFKFHKRAKLPWNIRVYEGNKDLKDHLGIFSATAGQEEWPMPIWCKMFCQTLGGVARIWFDDLDPKSVDSFEELSHKFLEEFSQKKELAKKLNDKILKTVDKMFKRVKAFIRGEVAAGSAEMVRSSQKDKGIKEKVILRTKNRSRRGLNFSRVSLARTEDKEDTEEEVFAWAGSKRTFVPRFFMKHQLKIYPFAEPMTHKRQHMASEGGLALKEKVFCWLKEGLIRKVQRPEWITNTILVKLTNGTWKVQVDYSSLNKFCAKDIDEVRSHHQNSREAGVSKDISDSELLALS
nr:hypothetical protein [Tanacetum cinerariifolium]